MSYSEEIRQFIVDNFLFGEDDGQLGDDTSFLESGIIDSTGILEVVTFIEEKFGISIDDTEMLPENLDTLQNLQVFLEKKQANQQQEISAQTSTRE